MGKKKNKVAKITEEEYYAYIAGLKTEIAPVSAGGKLLVPDPFSRAEPDGRKDEND